MSVLIGAQVPTELHGWIVKDARPRDKGRANFVLLAQQRGEQRWVTCVWSRCTGEEWVWGHYFRDHAKAVADFEKR